MIMTCLDCRENFLCCIFRLRFLKFLLLLALLVCLGLCCQYDLTITTHSIAFNF
jgi:hypothetical protein